MGELTTNEAAERLCVPLSTLKTWLFKLQIPTHLDSRGRRKFDEKALGLLGVIKSLRDDDCGYETIRRRIDPQVNSSLPDDFGEIEGTLSIPQRSFVDIEHLTEVIRTELMTLQGLSERITSASHRIGELEATVRFKDEKIAELSARLEEQARKIELLETSTRPWWAVFK